MLDAGRKDACVAGAAENVFEQWAEGGEATRDQAGAGFDGGPDGDVDGVPEEVVGEGEAADVAEAEEGADYAAGVGVSWMGRWMERGKEGSVRGKAKRMEVTGEGDRI